MAAMTWTGWVTFGLAIVGAVLGLFNTWQSWRDRRVRLRVTPNYSQPVGDRMQPAGAPCVAIDVQNLGAFPVTVVEVGLLIGRAAGDLPRRASFMPAAVVAGPSLPHRLEPHDAMSLVVPIISLSRQSYTSAYARTAAGHLIRGNSPALRSIADVIRSTT